ncbi:unnamed protein product, partial [Pylaiella littoralis]
RTHQRCALAFTNKPRQVCTRACTHNDLLSLLLIRLITTDDKRAARRVKPTDSVQCRESRTTGDSTAASAAAAVVSSGYLPGQRCTRHTKYPRLQESANARCLSRGGTRNTPTGRQLAATNRAPSCLNYSRQPGRAGSPKGEGGKYDNVSYVLARTIRSNLHREAAKLIGCTGMGNQCKRGQSLHERCRCSLEKEWTEYPPKWF